MIFLYNIYLSKDNIYLYLFRYNIYADTFEHFLMQ